jgi:LytS/YehU family sensor histidine kinase
MSVSYAFFMILVWSSLYFGINYHYRLVNEKQLHLDAVRLSHVAQIKMLRYQINPHFLFNTLNAISTLVLKGDKQKANGMLTRLATFLRFSLDNDPEKKIRLYEELKALMLYLEIEKTRFDERLSVKFQVEAKAEALLVPSLLLQPLVENSIKYAIAQMATGGVISISAYCKNSSLHLEVADNGPNSDNAQNTVSKPSMAENSAVVGGVGVQNIKERLAVLYPNKHEFHVYQEKPKGYRVMIVIPMEYP